ncbi:MAG: hypothetical protein ABSG74_07910, partial [Candidatus Bathyarchaeia archaeon]
MSSIEKPKSRNKIYIGIAVIVILLIAIGASVYFYTPQQAPVTTGGPLKVAFISSAPMEEPWTSVIHKALNYSLQFYGADKIAYKWTENVQYSDTPRVMREYGANGYNLVFVDAFGADDTARAAAKDFPNTYFVLGTDN